MRPIEYCVMKPENLNSIAIVDVHLILKGSDDGV
jgi:hypothetical protein